MAGGSPNAADWQLRKPSSSSTQPSVTTPATQRPARAAGNDPYAALGVTPSRQPPAGSSGGATGVIRPYTAGRKGRSAARFLQTAPALYRATTLTQAQAAITSDPQSQSLFVDAARKYYEGNPNFIDSWALGTFAERIFEVSASTGMNPGEIAARIASGELVVGSSGTDSAGGGGGGYYGGGGGGYGGGSSTQQSIDLTSPQQARGLIMQTMQGVLGRDPSEEEYSSFVSILNEAQTANPSVVTASGDTVTRSGGIDAGLLALDFAQSRDDYEDVQANQYYNMFLDVLAGG